MDDQQGQPRQGNEDQATHLGDTGEPNEDTEEHSEGGEWASLYPIYQDRNDPSAETRYGCVVVDSG